MFIHLRVLLRDFKLFIDFPLNALNVLIDKPENYFGELVHIKPFYVFLLLNLFSHFLVCITINIILHMSILLLQFSHLTFLEFR